MLAACDGWTILPVDERNFICRNASTRDMPHLLEERCVCRAMRGLSMLVRAAAGCDGESAYERHTGYSRYFFTPHCQPHQRLLCILRLYVGAAQQVVKTTGGCGGPPYRQCGLTCVEHNCHCWAVYCMGHILRVRKVRVVSWGTSNRYASYWLVVVMESHVSSASTIHASSLLLSG